MPSWNVLPWLRAAAPTAPHRRLPQRRCGVRLLLERLEDRLTPSSTITVSSSADSGANTLRAALAAANSGDVIDFAATFTDSAVRTIDLTSAGLIVANNVTIQNDLGTGPVTIDGGGNYTVFTVNSGVTASLSGLTIQNGSTSGAENAGGVFNSGTLTVTNCTISNNTASGFELSAGGVVNNGTLMVTNCTLSTNTNSDVDGEVNAGGVVNYGGGTLTVTNCTLSDNTNSGDDANAGAVLNIGSATLNVTDCTLSNNNSAGEESAGGILNYYATQAAVNNSTFFNNSAATGGGIYNVGSTLTVSDSTFSANRAGVGESGSGGGIDSNESATLNGDIVAGNFNGATGTTADDLAGSFSGANNLIGTGGSGGLTNTNGNQVDVSLADVGLAAGLANNGGPTQTIALMPGSFAIGKGDTFTTPTTDQRGLPRPVNSPSDVGAFQTQVQAEAVFNFPVGAGNSPVGGPGTGVYQYDPSTGLQSLTANNASAQALGLVGRQATTLATDAEGDVAAVFAGSNGVFRYMQSTQTWTQLSTGYATALTIDSAGDVVGVFPYSGDGFYVHRWTDAAGNFGGQVATAGASLLAGDANGDVVGEFANGGPDGGPSGVYEFTFADGAVATTTYLSSGHAVQLAMDSAGDAFGAFTNGVYESTTMTNSMVTQLTPGYAPLLAADAAGDLAGYFPYGSGVYEYTAGSEAFAAVPLTAPGAPSLLAMDSAGDLFGEFPGQGLYEAAAGGDAFATQLTSPLAPSLVTLDGLGNEFAVLGGQGVWRYTTANGWQELVTATPTALSADAAGDVVGAFSNGVYEYTVASGNFYTQLTSAVATELTIDAAGDVVGEFPYGMGALPHGVYRWTNDAGNFNQEVSSADAAQLVGNAAGDVVGYFPDYGVYESTTASPKFATAMLPGGATGVPAALAIDADGDIFGAFTNGVFEAAAESGAFSATPLNPGNATLLASDAAGDLAGYFPWGRPAGVYVYTAGAFAATPQTTVLPSVLTEDALGDVFVDLPGQGYYHFTVAGGLLLATGTEGDASLAV